ncbi:uncharacterized protein TrAtP1_000687 [Trichoderma atroviride]|uniref:uncharacterized protein n=1 Tax=Hypocrea atroviridis TaxID=63577 RepID=UPI003329C8B4|nr:hypothetical protein TrAtP1_000687 [Trichoderma atroviride]
MHAAERDQSFREAAWPALYLKIGMPALLRTRPGNCFLSSAQQQEENHEPKQDPSMEQAITAFILIIQTYRKPGLPSTQFSPSQPCPTFCHSRIGQRREPRAQQHRGKPAPRTAHLLDSPPLLRCAASLPYSQLFSD